MTEKEIAQIAAKAAVDAMNDKRDGDEARKRENYVASVRSLLKAYGTLQSYVGSACYEATYVADKVTFDDLMEDLMTPDRDVSVIVESIMKSAQRTKAVYEHITEMLNAYKRKCLGAGSPETARRRWRVIDRLYVSRTCQAIEIVADAEHLSERAVYLDIQTACEELAPYFFGVDALIADKEDKP